MSEFWFGFVCGAGVVSLLLGLVIYFLIDIMTSFSGRPWNW